MKICAIDDCGREAVFRTTTRPAWCDEHITGILQAGGLIPLEPFTKRDAFRLTRCTTCGCEAHYRLDYVLEKNSRRGPGRVCRACYMRQLAGKPREPAFVPPNPVDIEEVRRHAEQHGFEYLGPLPDGIAHRTRCLGCDKISVDSWGDISWGCQSCRQNTKRQAPPDADGKPTLLRDSDSRAIAWWDHDANPESLWRTAKLKARKKAAWRCPKCDTRFTETIYEMTGYLSERSCPTCKDRLDNAYACEQAELRTKTVADLPELAALWIDPTPANQVPVLDSGYYKFRCANGHQSTRRPYSYMRGCSYCQSAETRNARAAAAAANPAASRLSPELTSQWHPTRNGTWALARVSPNSRREAWWKDPVCGHEWQATPRSRDKYTRLRCPECETILDSLAFHYPEIAAQWAPENSTSPWRIRPTTSRGTAPTWICPNNRAHRWTASPASRVNGSTCPECQDYGKSNVELEHQAEARRQFGNAASGKHISSPTFTRRGTWTVDVLVDLGDGRQLAIEYDGCYWHADKTELDADKSRDLLAAGLIVVRVREHPLPPLGIDSPDYHEITVYSDAPDPAHAIERIEAVLRQ